MTLISHRKHSLINQSSSLERDDNDDDDDDQKQECSKDLLEVLIKSCLNNPANPRLRESDIVEECKSFFFAGKHTTSNLLVWTTILLAMHPQWQQLARDEVLRVCGARDTPSKQHVSHLKTVSEIPSCVFHIWYFYFFCLGSI